MEGLAGAVAAEIKAQLKGQGPGQAKRLKAYKHQTTQRGPYATFSLAELHRIASALWHDEDEEALAIKAKTSVAAGSDPSLREPLNAPVVTSDGPTA